MSEKINKNFISIAKRYSKALVSAAEEKELLDNTMDELKDFYEMYLSSRELQDILTSPSIKVNEKQSVLKELTKSFKNSIIKDFLFLLVHEGRFDAFETIYYCFNEEINNKKNIIQVEIKSVIELDEKQKERLIQKLSQKYEKTIDARYVTTPEIIGGLVISYEDKTIDLSIKSKFENLKKQLI